MGARRLTLADGAVLVIRPIAPEDRQALATGFERLSPESRYRRFFTPTPQLSERGLDYLTQVDHHDHEALIAIADPPGELVGVARFVRTGPSEAEPAIVVADEWQGRGLGGGLIDALTHRAREEGITRFRAPVLADNEAAIAVLGRLGPTVQSQVGHELELEIELAPGHAGRRRLAGLLRRVADGAPTSYRRLMRALGRRAPATAPEARGKTIVVGTDGSEPAGATVRVAADLARALGDGVELVGTGWPLITRGDTLDVTAGDLRRDGLEVGVHRRRGTRAAALVDVAVQRRARLIVVGGSRRTGAARLLPGELSDILARQAPCDVLIARPRPEAPG